jgi:hypothetical protein
VVGQGDCIDGIQVTARFIGYASADGEAGNRPVEHPLSRLSVGQRLRQQLFEVDHLDAARADEVGEHVVLLASATHPQDVVEQQVVVVFRGQP